MSTHTINGGWLHGRLGTAVLWALLICTESAGQLFTKVAGDQLGQMAFTWQWLAEVARNPGILAAIACYIGAFFVWMLIPRRSSLSLAFPLSSLVFVGVLLGSWLGLGNISARCTGWGGGDYRRYRAVGRRRRKLSLVVGAGKPAPRDAQGLRFATKKPRPWDTAITLTPAARCCSAIS
jgi:hypothetical protein